MRYNEADGRGRALKIFPTLNIQQGRVIPTFGDGAPSPLAPQVIVERLLDGGYRPFLNFPQRFTAGWSGPVRVGIPVSLSRILSEVLPIAIDPIADSDFTQPGQVPWASCMSQGEDVGRLRGPKHRTSEDLRDRCQRQQLGAGTSLLLPVGVEGNRLIAHHLPGSIPVGFSMANEQQPWHR